MLYFVTAARGTEDFVIDELNCKCQPTRIRKTDGKVFFELVSSNSCNLEILLSLKSVERLFVAALYNPDFRIFSKGGVYHLEKALASINNWNLCLETWRACHPSQLRCTKDAATADMEHLSQKDDEGKLDGDKDDTPSKRRKMEEQQEECGETFEPTFRVSCKCSGSAAKFFTPQHLSKVVGHQLKKQTGWKVQLRRPLLEVMVQINNGGLTVGVPLSEQPLSHRPYIKTIGLRSTLAWILTQLAKIQHGDIVLDPMCGSGTILVEAARSSPDAIYFGSDTSDRQLTLALENVNLAKVCGKVQLFQADVTHLPHILGHRDVDRIICDVPFGINHSCVKDVKELYPTLIRALDSVLASHGRVVLLTSTDLKDFLLKQVELMNTTGTPVSSLLQETCPGSSVYGDTTTTREAQRHCVSQETRTKDPLISCASQQTKALTFCSLLSCDGHETKTTKDSLDCSLTAGVCQETKLTDVSTDYSTPSCTSQETKITEDSVNCSISSRIVCGSEQLSLASEAVCTESCREGHVVCCSIEMSDHDNPVSYTAVAGCGSAESTVARGTDTVVTTERLVTTSSHWQLESTHYFKLGETHAHACVFQKKSIFN